MSVDADALGAALAALLRLPGDVAELRAEVAALRMEVAALRKTVPPALVDVSTAAERLGLSEATVRRRIKDGSLPSQRVGRAVRIDLATVRPLDADEVARLAHEARAGA